jgi:hypothetical protein
VSRFDSPPGPSPATPQGRLVEEAGNLGSQPGWRGRAGRTIAYVTLTAGALVVLVGIVGIVWLFAS